jgi:nitroreductase
MQDVQGLSDEVIIPRLARLEKFLKDDFDLLTDERNLLDWTGKQAYIALAHMMIMAATMDIDSCPIEGFVKDKVDEVLASYQLIDPKVHKVAVMVSFGYRDEPIKPKKRRAISEVVEWIK